MPAVLDCRRLTAAQKQAGLTAAGGELKLAQPGDLLEGAELQAGMEETACRAGRLKAGSLVFLLPQTWPPLLQAFQTDWDSLDFDGQQQESLRLLQWAKEGAEQPDNQCLLLLPVHAHAPQHWTLLSLFRQSGSSQFQVQYWDSLAKEAANNRLAAQASLNLFAHWLGEARLSDTVLPPSSVSRKQTDGWSCGVWSLLFAEQLVRQLRGEGVRLVDTSLPDRLASLNKYLQAVLVFKKAKDSKPAPAAAVAVPVPDLPAPTVLGLAKLASLPARRFGCSRRTWAATGCLSSRSQGGEGVTACG